MIGETAPRRLATLLVAAALTACGDAHHAGQPAPPATPTPAELAEGEAHYGRHCVECHGERGIGTMRGPPLLHPVYEPSHHPDAAFHVAVVHGVRAHHWRYGDMPPLPDVTPDQIEAITAYIRWLQREVGIE